VKDHDLAATLLLDHFTASAALITLMLENLPDAVRTRALDAMRNGTGKVELRTRVQSNSSSTHSGVRRGVAESLRSRAVVRRKGRIDGKYGHS
jgi:hypothetical protein